ncbi:O-antigen ligase [Pseudorhizobium tarimense]|uniref:O-antigen ligase n=1 Tax=Pseudorhizobium tarimense TaxID=1079109 RepID=A0ABV2H640_9HYPH|nr:O-antigen ligase family protein [Pseudorhizobium tarimense]MCJ8519271.1 O-antigen ligase family protein [Pseudorhizobium tarimense]
MPSSADRASAHAVRAQGFMFPILWVLMASAMIVESDVYRYVTIGLAIFVLVRHLPDVSWASRDWLALLCYAWTAYVLLRFIAGIVLFDEKGASEWLYAFPALFPLIGVALIVSRPYLFKAATILIACALVALLATLDASTAMEGQRAAPLFHHNPIHAGVGSAMLFISSVAWLLHAAETGRLATRAKWSSLILGIATAIFSLLGLLFAQSKGVWLALALTVALWPLAAVFHLSGRWRLYASVAIAIFFAASIAIALPYILAVAGPTMDAATALLRAVFSKDGLTGAMRAAIEAATTPEAMRQRLMLWVNALELIGERPFFGWGNRWLLEWRRTTYTDVGHTLLHNGYLEILVRHGLMGLIFLGLFIVAGVRRFNEATRRGEVAQSVRVYVYTLSFFFFCTILTNSNNRLALGESYFILAGATVFAVTLLNKQRRSDESV